MFDVLNGYVLDLFCELGEEWFFLKGFSSFVFWISDAAADAVGDPWWLKIWTWECGSRI